MGLSIFPYHLSPRDIKIHLNKCKKKLSELREGGREERRQRERLGGREGQEESDGRGREANKKGRRTGGEGEREGTKSIIKSTFKDHVFAHVHILIISI